MAKKKPNKNTMSPDLSGLYREPAKEPIKKETEVLILRWLDEGEAPKDDTPDFESKTS